MKYNKNFLKLLINLLSYNTYSGNEAIMTPFITKELKNIGFKVFQDKAGNIYAERGYAKEYPLLNAHMDIVYDYQTTTKVKKITSVAKCSTCDLSWNCANTMSTSLGVPYAEARKVLISTNKVCGNYTDIDDYDYYGSYVARLYDKQNDKKSMEECDAEFKVLFDSKTGIIKGNGKRILGGDDKCGIALAIQTARDNALPMKLLFTVEEEIGCIGITEAIEQNPEWFSDVKYSLTLDRRGYNDLLMYALGKQNCTREFAAEVAKQGILAGIDIKINDGSVADVIELRDIIIDCINMSVCYYEAHTLNEFIKFYDMINTKQWIKNILTTL